MNCQVHISYEIQVTQNKSARIIHGKVSTSPDVLAAEIIHALENNELMYCHKRTYRKTRYVMIQSLLQEKTKQKGR